MHAICILSLRNSSYFYLFNCTSEVDVRNFRCRCANCQRLNRVLECGYCREIDCVGFRLFVWIVGFYRRHGISTGSSTRTLMKTLNKKKNRHIAYRQLARWCWGVLGKEIRVTLPSCAVCCIRAHFPPPGIEEDFTFEGFRFADE